MELKIIESFSQLAQSAKRAVGWGEPTSQELLQKALFASGPSLPKGNINPLLSGHSMGSAFVVSDYTSLYRASHDALVYNLKPEISNQGIFKHGLGESRAVSLGYHAFGLATGLNVIIGLVQAVQAYRDTQVSKKVEDTRGTLMGRLEVAKGLALARAGGSFVAYRAMAMLETVKHVPHFLSKSTTGLGNTGTGFYALFFVLISAVFGIKLYEDAKFRHTLNQAKNLEEAVELIQRKTVVDRDKIYAKLVKKAGSEEAAKKLLIEEAYENGKDHLVELLSELGIKKPSDEKLKEILHKVIENGCKSWTAAGVAQEVEAALIQAGLDSKVGKVQVKKQRKLTRLFGEKALEAIKAMAEDKTLVKRVKIKDPDGVVKAKRLLDIIRADSTKRIMVDTFVLSVCLLGIAAMVAALVFSSGTALPLVAILSLVFCVGMLGVDGYYLLESYREEKPAQHDKKMLVLSSVIAVTSFVAVVALGLSGICSMGIVPLIISGVLLALWLGQNGITWAIMNRNERLHRLKHPTLEILLSAIQSREEDERIAQMIDKMPKEIAVELKRPHVDKETAVLALIQKVEASKAQRLEQVREILTPILIS